MRSGLEIFKKLEGMKNDPERSNEEKKVLSEEARVE